LYPPELRSTNLDFDWIYRRAFPVALQNMFSVIWKTDSTLRQMFLVRLDLGLAYLSRRNERISYLLSRTYPAGSMVMWVAVILASYLFLSFITH